MTKGRDAKLIEVAAELRHQTADAFLLDDGSAKEWVPRALVEDNEDGTFTMPEWLATEKGFI
jgi:hypothetical protein